MKQFLKHMMNSRNRLVLLQFTFLAVLAVIAGPAAAENEAARLVANDLTITDTVTGAVWHRSANSAGRQMSWYDAKEYIKMLNQEKYAGFSDWRLPEIGMLMKLFAAVKETGGRSDRPADMLLKDIGFQDFESGDYWSSTISFFNTAEVWYVNMIDGHKSTGNKSLYLNVWPVRYQE